MQDIRWKQRFNNYRKAFFQLTEFIEKDALNKFEIQGLIQCFEYTFELAWKTIKDYLEQEGFEVKSPRAAIQTAFQSELVTDGHTWIDMLQKRNLMAHTYNEKFAEEAEQLIREKYYLVLKELYEKLEEQV
ncbi:nucleotidyltransferase substrate binding protein [Microaerobacter geothermalis]|uniref:nucleotidyltransferase substrate binding protein n=1 Tax=Microaerobacter geothermalis TaxID=674972 RepID=UPI001F42CF15|nr:nucleotidyltransferase substrate binding protein [Microaerobacter geothermalis]MCF6092538.1 nucleotidyltransferase substrate binding protein [Microaerobacter geothermalis]